MYTSLPSAPHWCSLLHPSNEPLPTVSLSCEVPADASEQEPGSGEDNCTLSSSASWRWRAGEYHTATFFFLKVLLLYILPVFLALLLYCSILFALLVVSAGLYSCPTCASCEPRVPTATSLCSGRRGWGERPASPCCRTMAASRHTLLWRFTPTLPLRGPSTSLLPSTCVTWALLVFGSGGGVYIVCNILSLCGANDHCSSV